MRDQVSQVRTVAAQCSAKNG